MDTNDYIICDFQSQVDFLLRKTAIKKSYNKNVVSFLNTEIGLDKAGLFKDRLRRTADNILGCATYLGFTEHNGRALIGKANFCRERICYVCAWRRQAKFLAQIKPILNLLGCRGYQFLFATLTVKNCCYADLDSTVSDILAGFSKLLKRRKFARGWCGVARAVELTYNESDNTFHPHLHLLIAVEEKYFSDSSLYISQRDLCLAWAEVLGLDYIPSCDIRKVTEESAGAVETFKYTLKPSRAIDALRAFYYVLRGRRLISFSGVFADVRRELRLSDFESVLTDDVVAGGSRKFRLYEFDATGGVYRFYKDFDFDI